MTNKARHPALERLHRFDYACTSEIARATGEPARSSTTRAPVRWRVWRRAYRPAYQPAASNAPEAAWNAPGNRRASRKRLPHATSFQDDHRPGPNSTATPGHCVTATARGPVAPNDAGAQRRSSVAVATPCHIVCTQVLCESAPPFSLTLTRADRYAAHPAFTLLPQAGQGTGQVQRASSTTRHRIWRP